MVEKRVYTTPAFRRMISIGYYTSNKCHVEIGRESNTRAAGVSRWLGFIGLSFWEGCPFVRKALPLRYYQISARS